MMTSDESLSLVRRAADGDLVAQDTLIRNHQDRLAAFVFALTGKYDTVEDLTQGIFLKMLLKLPQLREEEKFEPWLFRLARNACRDHFRREKWRRFLVPFAPEFEEVAMSGPPAGPDIGDFLAALKSLPPSQRELLVLLQEKEWSYAELAEITGSSTSSVKSRLFRARTGLKKILDHE